MRKIYFIIIMFVAACSPQKRLSRLLALHPELLKTDTISRVDTIIHTKTIIKPSDTVTVINKDTVVDTKYNTIYITKETVKVITKPDTCYIHDTTFVHKLTYRDKYTTPSVDDEHEIPYSYLVYIIITILVIGFIYIIRKRQ